MHLFCGIRSQRLPQTGQVLLLFTHKLRFAKLARAMVIDGNICIGLKPYAIQPPQQNTKNGV